MYQFLVKTKAAINLVLSTLCTVLLVFMTFLVIWQVFTRYVLNDPASFTEELVRYSLIWTGFIGAAYAFSTREHMALTFLRDSDLIVCAGHFSYWRHQISHCCFYGVLSIIGLPTFFSVFHGPNFRRVHCDHSDHQYLRRYHRS